ncbi:hypothetical protein ACK389_10575 [Streptomyces antibioticus]|uniref:hypothetical protein n=1 Tax=Streptomyces TaxID=1883 RepID=UPI0016726FC2|nr:hypothetical protein [Streptomyces tanashiensis]
MPPPELDLRLDGFEAADEQTDEVFWHAIEIEQDMLTVLAEHHTDEDAASYYVLHNGAATYGIPGEPQVVALHLQRDLAARTFRFEHTQVPLPVMAQSWLISRGCPPDVIRLPPGTGTAPADETTRVLEERLMGDGDRFALLTSYTNDDPDSVLTLVVLRALDERAPSPFRVLHEDVSTDTWTHTLREGGFATFEGALQWYEECLAGNAGPLPSVTPKARSLQTRGAAPTAPVGRPSGRRR